MPDSDNLLDFPSLAGITSSIPYRFPSHSDLTIERGRDFNMLPRLVFTALLLLSAFTVLCAASAVPPSSSQGEITPSQHYPSLHSRTLENTGSDSRAIVPRGYIIEFADDAEQQIAQVTGRSGASLQVHEEFHKFMARSISALQIDSDDQAQTKRDVVTDDLASAFSDVLKDDTTSVNISSAYTLRYTWDQPGIYRGLSLILESDRYAQLLSKAPGVVNVSPIRVVPAPDSRSRGLPNGFVEQYAAALQQKAAADGTTEATTSAATSPGLDIFGTNQMMGVDRLHAEGYTGKGIVIGVIDTGETLCQRLSSDSLLTQDYSRR